MRVEIPNHIDLTLSAIRVILKVAVDPLSPQTGNFLGCPLVFGEFGRGWTKFFSHPGRSHNTFHSASRHSTPSEPMIFSDQ